MNKICSPSLWPSVHAGLQGWQLGQGEGARNGGQRLMIHELARRTIDWKWSPCCSASAFKWRRPESHRPCPVVPQRSAIMMWTFSKPIARTGGPPGRLSGTLRARRHDAWRSGAALLCRNSYRTRMQHVPPQGARTPYASSFVKKVCRGPRQNGNFYAIS